MTLDKDALAPEMPRFDSYFDAKSQDVHPFERIKNSFDESEIRDGEEDAYERQRDAELHKRELMGRLIGQTLTPRQFEMLSGMDSSGTIKNQRYLDNRGKQYLTNQDQIRLFEEHIEKMRRQKIKSGEWQEETSMQEVERYLAGVEAEVMDPKERKKYYRDLEKAVALYEEMDNPESLLEKEYHFDETCGVSLDDHITSLKSQFPNGRIETRRDRDGFAVIKVSHKQEFKYNLDRIVNYDFDVEKVKEAETNEILLKHVLPKDLQLSELANLPKEELMEKLNTQIGQKYDLTYESKLEVEELMRERVNGKFRDDKEAFEMAFVDLHNNLTFDTSKPLKSGTLLDAFMTDGSEEAALHQRVSEDLFNDRDTYRYELANQLHKKINKHWRHTKRETKDFIKPKTSETNVYANQQRSIDNSIESMKTRKDEMEAQEDFDKEAYTRLK